jgi:putative ABC transport system ATP-binding protein
LFNDLWKQGNTIVMITHDESIAQRCERVIHLKDGKIENGIYNGTKSGN